MAEAQPVIGLQEKLQDFLTSSGFTDAEYKLPAIIERDGSAGYHYSMQIIESSSTVSLCLFLQGLMLTASYRRKCSSQSVKKNRLPSTLST
jgi:hypothetical protein